VTVQGEEATEPGCAAGAGAGGIAGIVRLAAYPVDRLESPEGRALVARCRAMLAADGACLLHDFLTDAALAQAIAEAKALAPRAYRRPSPSSGTAYIAAPDPSFPPDHPRNRIMSSFVAVVGLDQVPQRCILRRLYEWDGLLRFLSAVLARAEVYRYADPMGGLNVTVMRRGDHDSWHFDQTDFVVSMLLQPSDEGGDFEYSPHIRTAEDENYDGVRRVFDGDRGLVRRLDLRLGTFALFLGRNSLHRVAPVEGEIPRIIALFGYDTRPGTMSSERLRLGRYGRTEPLAAPPDL
jgi:hypothetical protein